MYSYVACLSHLTFDGGYLSRLTQVGWPWIDFDRPRFDKRLEQGVCVVHKPAQSRYLVYRRTLTLWAGFREETFRNGGMPIAASAKMKQPC